MNVLITSASNKVWLIQAFRKALINNGGGKVYAADINAEKIALYYADEFRLLLNSDEQGFIPEVLSLCLEENIELVIPTRDGELQIFSENKILFEENNIKIMVSNPDSINVCSDKYFFYQYCYENNIPAIPTWLDKNLESDLSFPVFVKPRKGSASKNTYIAASAMKLEQFLLLYDEIEFVIQPFISCQEYTIDLFSDFDERIISVVPRQRIKVLNGESIVGKIDINQKIIDETKRLAKFLHLIGHNTIQCFYDKKTEQINFVEVNPRFGGGAESGFSAGAFTPELLIQHLSGKKLKPVRNNEIDKLWMFKYSQSVSLIKNNEGYIKKTDKATVFCIDIDGTICTEFCHYEDAKPVDSVINKINNLYNEGHTIILFTSRGYTSGCNWMPLLEKQMKNWNVLYHEIKQGKPYADYYIDNKSLNVLDWL